MEQANSLASYDGLTSNKGIMTKARYRAQAPELLAVRTVYIMPTVIASKATLSTKDPSERALVANAINRALCIGVSDRLQVVDNKESADLVVHATITRIVATDRMAAGVSTVASLGASFVLPVPVPRLPLGLGGIAVEAEATTKDGRQVAAMVWARGANAITTSARVSQVGDAYALATNFGNDFSKMLVTGKTPFKGLPDFPSAQKFRSDLGGKMKYQSCERFGRAPGLKDIVASQVGMPPSWTDKPSAVQNP